jgi:hypothetical protein
MKDNFIGETRAGMESVCDISDGAEELGAENT